MADLNAKITSMSQRLTEIQEQLKVKNEELEQAKADREIVQKEQRAFHLELGEIRQLGRGLPFEIDQQKAQLNREESKLKHLEVREKELSERYIKRSEEHDFLEKGLKEAKDELTNLEDKESELK